MKIKANSCLDAIEKYIKVKKFNMIHLKVLAEPKPEEIEAIGADFRLYESKHSSMIGDVSFTDYILVRQDMELSNEFELNNLPEWAIQCITKQRKAKKNA